MSLSPALMSEGRHGSICSRASFSLGDGRGSHGGSHHHPHYPPLPSTPPDAGVRRKDHRLPLPLTFSQVVCLQSIYLCVGLPNPPIYLSVCLFVCLSVYLYVCLLVRLPAYLPVYLPVCHRLYLTIYLQVCLSIYLYICQSVYMSVCLSIFLPIYLCVCLTATVPF